MGCRHRICVFTVRVMVKVSYANEKLIFACTNTMLRVCFCVLKLELYSERHTGICNAKNMVFSGNLEHYFENVYVLVGHTLAMFTSKSRPIQPRTCSKLQTITMQFTANKKVTQVLSMYISQGVSNIPNSHWKCPP